jgi:DNA-binding transcriptional LysR family regulator
MALGLHHLRYVVVIAEERNVTRAARRLHLSQPSLSAALRDVERQVGADLFLRRPWGMALTPAGEAFVAEARRAVDAAEAAVTDARRAARGARKHLRVGFIVGTQVELTSQIVAAFRSRHPEVALNPVEHTFADPSAGLRSEQVEVAFVMPPFISTGLVLEELLTAPRVAVLSSSHPLAERGQISIRELFDEPWIYADTDDDVCRSYWLAMEHRTSPPILGEGTRTIDRFIQLAMAGEVVGLAADWVRTAFTRPGLAFIRVPDVAPAMTALGWRADASAGLVADFVDTARAVRDAASDPNLQRFAGR